MLSRPLSPSWVSAVPLPFQGTARTIERRRITLEGDPAALAAAADSWEASSAQVDAAWQEVHALRGRALSSWEGKAADSYDMRADGDEGNASGVAMSLWFAADGLRLAAKALRGTRERAEVAILEYVKRTRAMYQAALAQDTGRSAAAAVSGPHAALANTTYQIVYQQQVQLDHVLASLPERFNMTGDSPMSRDVSGTLLGDAASLIGNAGVSVWKTFGGSAEGLGNSTIHQRLDGTFEVTREIGGAVGIKGKLGDKSNLAENKFLNQLIELEGRGGAQVLGKYRFGTRDEAEDFAGNPWAILARQADETAIKVQVSAKGLADLGIPSVVGAQGAAGGGGEIQYAMRDDGSTALTVTRTTEAVGGVEISSEVVATGGKKTVAETIEFDDKGDPTAHIRRDTVDHDFKNITGNNQYVGVETPIGELYIKGQTTEFTRNVSTVTLDLTDPDNRAEFDRRQLASTVPVTFNSQYQDFMAENGVTVNQEQEVVQKSGTVSGGSEYLGKVKGVRIETEIEIRESSYTRGDDPGGTDKYFPVSRPVPRKY